jgi:hypothetical protein
MRIVFHAANSLDAHIVKDLLAMQGIRAFIMGEHLQGGIGTLPAFDLVKIMVDDASYGAAIEIVAQWNAQ